MFDRFFPLHSKQRGIFFALCAMALFSIMAAIAKHFSGTYSAYQIAFFRFLFAFIIIIPLVIRDGGINVFKTRRIKGHAWRGLMGTLSLVFYFLSLEQLPLADAVAVSFINPIFVVLFSMWLLKETVHPKKWIAILLGFIGVVVIAEPYDLQLNIGVVYGLLSAMTYGITMVSLRSLGDTEKVLTTTTYHAISSILLLGIPSALTWHVPTLSDLVIFIACGVFAGIGQLCLTSAYQNTTPSVIGPFNYTSILWATLIGFVVWGHIPEPHVWIGAVIIIISGIYIAQHRSTAHRTNTAEKSLY